MQKMDNDVLATGKICLRKFMKMLQKNHVKK